MRRALVGATFAICFAVAHPALAYCLTTVCRSKPEVCPADFDGICPAVTDLNPATHWPTACVSYAVQQDGEPKQGITGDDLVQAVTTAFDTWSSANCYPGSPQITATFRGQVACDQPEFDCGDQTKNLNVVMFQEEWPHDRFAIALTTINLNLTTGEILDADLELNSKDFQFVTSGPTGGIKADLVSVVTHEVGHFLGLDHSEFKDATMYGYYNPTRSDIAALHPDDMQGICAAYGASDEKLDCPSLPSVEGAQCTGGRDCEDLPQEGGCSCWIAASESRAAPGGVLLLLLCLLRRKRSRGARTSALKDRSTLLADGFVR